MKTIWFLVLLLLIPSASAVYVDFGDGTRGPYTIGNGQLTIYPPHAVKFYGKTEINMLGKMIVKASIEKEDVIQLIDGLNNAEITYVKRTIEEEKWYTAGIFKNTYHVFEEIESVNAERVSMLLSSQSDSRFFMVTNGAILASMDSGHRSGGDLGKHVAAISFSNQSKKVYSITPNETGCPDTYLPMWEMLGSSAVAMNISSTTIDFIGECRLMFCGPYVEALIDGSERDYETGVKITYKKGDIYINNLDIWVGAGSHKEVEIEWIEVRIPYGSFSLSLDSTEIYTQDMDCNLNGTLYAPKAIGNITVGRDFYDINNEELYVAGNFYIQAGPDDDGIDMYVGRDFVFISTPRFSKIFPWAGAQEISIISIIIGGLIIIWKYLSRYSAGIIGLIRISNSEILNQKTRKKIYEIIKNKPGLSFKEIQDKTGLGWGTTVYHVKVLKKEGYIGIQKIGKEKRCFVPDANVNGKLVCARRDSKCSAIISAIESHKGITLCNIAAKAGLSPQIVSKRAKFLENIGVIKRIKDGVSTRHYLIE